MPIDGDKELLPSASRRRGKELEEDKPQIDGLDVRLT